MLVAPDPVTAPVRVMVWLPVRNVAVQPPNAPTAEIVVGAWFAKHGLVEPAKAENEPLEPERTKAAPMPVSVNADEVTAPAPLTEKGWVPVALLTDNPIVFEELARICAAPVNDMEFVEET